MPIFDSEFRRLNVNWVANYAKKGNAGAESRTPDSTIMSRVL